MHHRLGSVSLVVVLGLGAGAAACLDITPITDVPMADGGGVDVSVSPAVAKSACFQCTSGTTGGGPSCSAEYAACGDDPKCLSLFLCGIPRGCYEAGHDLVECLTGCGVAAGLTGTDDPAVAPFLALYQCATTSCSTSCGAATSSADAAPPACEAPRGASCPPIAGNCKGIGAPCTKGGGECGPLQATCEKDLDPRGREMCVTILTCVPGGCGTGATCCKTPTTQDIPICMPNQCLAPDCTADP